MQIDRQFRRKIRIFATQVYIYEVLVRSGTKSFGHLQKRLFKSQKQSTADFWDQSSGIFYKHADGAKPIKEVRLINRIEAEWPGTKSMLSHPLWFILENPLSDIELIHNQMRLLNGSVKCYVFSNTNQTDNYSRKAWKNIQSFYQIGAQNNLDSLACLLMVIREMEILKRWHTCALAKRFAHELFLRLAGVKPLNLIANRLYKIIYTVFMERDISLTIRKNKKTEVFHPPLPDVVYPTPSFVLGDNLFNDELIEIIELAKKYLPNLEMDDQRSELKFLFWAYTFGLERTRGVLQQSSSTLENKEFTDKLIEAHKINLPSAYAPHHALID